MTATYRQNDAKLHMINLVHHAAMKLSESGFIVERIRIDSRAIIIIDRALDDAPKTKTATHWLWDFENCLVGCLCPAIAEGEDLYGHV
jgi:hypothetical protein